MNLRTISLFALTIIAFACQKEDIEFSSDANETFYVEHEDSKMRVQVRGNTLSDKIVLTVHGGPGGSSYYLSHLEQMKNIVESSYAVAYWDQPIAGASQGNRVSASIGDISEGLRKVVLTLRHRYGNKKVILFSESWGGIVTTAFLTKAQNQYLVQGWINSDGPHDFNLMDREIIKMAIRIGEEQILAGKNVNTWQNIVQFCKTSNPANNYEVSKQLNELLGDAEYLIDEVVKVEFNTIDVFRSQMNENNAPFTAMGMNLFSNSINEVEKNAFSQDFTKRVMVIEKPILLLWGKYDFIAPPSVADSLFSNVSSTDKRMVILPRSGHNAFLQEPDLYWKEFMDFIKRL